MVAYNKYQIFTKDLIDGVHDFNGDVFMVGLTAAAPDPAGDAIRTPDAAELPTSGGYTLGGKLIAVTTSTASGVAKATTVTNPVWTGDATTFSFAHAFLYNDSSAEGPTDPLIAFWSYGSLQPIGNGETLTIDFDDSAGIFTIV